MRVPTRRKSIACTVRLEPDHWNREVCWRGAGHNIFGLDLGLVSLVFDV